MELLNEDLQHYIEIHTSEEPPLLQKLSRETYAKVLMPRMLSGHLQGRVLSMISTMIRPRRILEIGTFTGYSAICLAEGLDSEGMLYTIDINEELEEMVRRYFSESGYENKIDYRIGDARDIITVIDQTLDLVFIDADKINYSHYYDLVFDKVKKNGFIIADNVLWSGKVVSEVESKTDKDTQAIMRFNDKVQQDKRVQNVLFPLRDGLMVLRKL